MADYKISQLPTTGSAGLTDELETNTARIAAYNAAQAALRAQLR